MFYFLLLAALANNNPAVIINEMAWIGDKLSHANEWIELKNNTDQEINLDGWIIEAEDGAPKINITGKIPAKGFYLLERGEGYSGALENNGEILELRDNSGNLIDKVDASSGWPTGDNDTKQTMEKTASGWQTSSSAGGTPKAENSKIAVQLKQQLAAVSNSLEQASVKQNLTPAESPSYIYLIASALAIFSGVITLIVRRSTSNK